MARAFLLAALALLYPQALVDQPASVLHVSVVLADADGQARPVPRHALLISENPASAPPRKVTTGLDGTVDVKLRPGNYTVESDQPVGLDGKAYQWTQIVDIAAGRETNLSLTLTNAEVGALVPLAPGAAVAAAPEADPSFLFPHWRDSVFAIWTAKTHASGFLADAGGLVVTNQRVIGSETMVEVQLTPAIKVRGAVVTTDEIRDLAILRIDPATAASLEPVPVACGGATADEVAKGQEVFTIGTPLRQEKGIATGTVSAVTERRIESDLLLPMGSAGGPVFNAGGALVGVTSQDEDSGDRGDSDARIIRTAQICEALAMAQKRLAEVAAPAGTRLPVEPTRPIVVETLKAAVKGRAGGLNPYQMAAADFDLSFITPVLTYAAEYQVDQERRPERTSGRSGPPPPPATSFRPLLDFGRWSDYVSDRPPVLLVRVTPKMVESFWTTIARGAARTQGMAIPPIKHFKSGFARLRAYCGDAEVLPIHPFKLEQRVSDSEGINEGLYVFDPGAFGPSCGTVKLVLFSEKEPDKADSRVVDPTIVQQIWDDFASYRAGGG
ncbi:MAG: serine protease [Vicinamibacterales bacterium]